MINSHEEADPTPGSVGAWAKSYYFAVRAAMESVLRPYDLGSTQWYVLYQLANDRPTMPRSWQQPFGCSSQQHDDSTITWQKASAATTPGRHQKH